MELIQFFMDFSKWNISPTIALIGSALLGAALTAWGANYAAKKNAEKDLNDYKQEVGRLKSQIERQGSELSLKDDKIVEISTANANLLSKIDENNKLIQKVVGNTNFLTTSIKNEIREKGSFKFTVTDYPHYNFSIGTNKWKVSKQDLISGYIPTVNGVDMPIKLKLVENEILLTALIRARGKLVVAKIRENAWSVNKSLCHSINYDDKGLEIIDISGMVVLQLQIEKDSFTVNLVEYGTYAALVANDNGITSYMYSDSEFDKHINSAKMTGSLLFQHEGEDYLGKRK